METGPRFWFGFRSVQKKKDLVRCEQAGLRGWGLDRAKTENMEQGTGTSQREVRKRIRVWEWTNRSLALAMRRSTGGGAEEQKTFLDNNGCNYRSELINKKPSHRELSRNRAPSERLQRALRLEARIENGFSAGGFYSPRISCHPRCAEFRRPRRPKLWIN